MSDASQPQSRPSTRSRSKAPERILLGLAVLLIGVGVLSVPLRRLLTPPDQIGVTGEVLEELQPAERIAVEPGVLDDYNLVIITTDTTRADRLHAYGNRSVSTPTLDRLAREGVLFANAITPSPSTMPSHSSLMTGLYPIHHGVRANGTFKLEDGITTLAEHLGEAGWRTGAVISAFVLDSRFGLDQGFELYHDDLTRGVKLSPHMFRERAAELTNEPALNWLIDHADERFFLWVHYFDPHAAYLPPEPFRENYTQDLYDGEIAYVDSQIGALLAELENLGLGRKTLVVYTSDHGEGLGEHGEQTHSLLTYDPTLRIPLIVHAPERLPQGVVVERQVSSIDVVPTVLSLLGVPPLAGLDGVDLTEPPEPGPRSIYFESIAPMTLHGWAPLMGIRRDDYKYILAPTPELYDLRDDPKERDNLHEEEAEIAAELRDELVVLLGADPLVAAQVTTNLELDPEMRSQLAALGYVHTVSETSEAEARAEFDPKEMIYHWEQVQQGINLRAQGQLDEAIPILEKSVAEVEGDLFARNVLAGAYQMRGEFDRAMELYEGSAEFEPNDEGILLGMAGVQMSRGALEEAEALIRSALELESESASAYLGLGRLALLRRKPEEARALFEQAIEMDPGTSGPTGYVQIGWLELRAHRLEEARQAFREALRIDGLNGPARDGLANVLIAEQKLDEAAQMLAQALRFDPNQPRALASLASLISRGEDQEQAFEVVNRALELSPKSPEAHNALGLIYRRQGQYELAEEHYRKSIEYGPVLDKPHVNLAQLYTRQERHDDAREQFSEALLKNRFNKVALANLGAGHYNEGRPDEAYRFYRRALAIDPDYALVHRNLGALYIVRDQPQLAAHHLGRSLELEPRQPGAEEMRYQISQAEETLRERRAGGSGGSDGS